MSELELKEITKLWGGNMALDHISFIMNCDVLGIVGPNGAGKTTLLNIIAGTVYPTEGKVYYNNKDITYYKPWERVKIGIGKTFQIVRPLRSLTVEENILLFSGIRNRVDVDEILKITGLIDFKDKNPAVLPFGLLKNLELAKVLAADPELLLLDEPFGGLSEDEISNVFNLISSLKEKKRKIIIIEHKISSLLPLLDRIIFLDRGKKIFEGGVKDFVENENINTFYFGGRL
ncbi:MAG: ATP-binding cassette domain-containing protein [Thermoplasmata archaeon]